MEFLTLLIWLLLGGLGTLLAPFALTTPGNALVALGAFGGTAAAVLYLVLDQPLWAAWAQVGAAAIGLLGSTFAAAQLFDGSSLTGGVAEEVEASALGLALPFFGTVLFCAMLIATQLVEPVI
jgi:hypothetical protein